MSYTQRSFFAVSASLLFLLMLAASSTARAHPPHAPFENPFGDDSRFAPITRFGPKVSIELAANGMTAPLKGVSAPGLSRYLFVVDQPGIVWAVDLKNPDVATNKTVFLDVRPRIVQLGVCGPDSFDERGLLGIAFAPDFRSSGKFYTFTSERRDRPDRTTSPLPTPGTSSANADHQNVVAEWRANNPGNPGAGTNMGSRREILHANWPQFNHDGGDLAFGPDGMLYISLGDGGGADDADGQPFVTAPPHYPFDTNCNSAAPIFGHQDNGNAQKLNTVLGKILRIDVRHTSPGKPYRVPSDNPFVGRTNAVPEIWALGFRNPFRMSFDRSGNLYVGDVGQNDIEEVDIVKRGGNYGWNCKEGTAHFYVNGSEPDDGFASRNSRLHFRRGDCASGPRPFINPVAEYDTHREGHSVIGGFVYYGDQAKELRGKYVFSDFSLLFKFPRGPHDYGRVFTIDAHGGGHDGLRPISELIFVPGGAVSLALLGMGQDADGEVYVMGNISGLPFGSAGRVLRLVSPEDADHHHHDRDD